MTYQLLSDEIKQRTNNEITESITLHLDNIALLVSWKNRERAKFLRGEKISQRDLLSSISKIKEYLDALDLDVKKLRETPQEGSVSLESYIGDLG